MRVISLILLAAPVWAQYGAPHVLAQVKIRGLAESSGVAASQAHSGILWTHNDSGDGPNLFAMDRAGKLVGRWTVTGARAIDWEDIALGPGGLYVGDIGDNQRKRPAVTVYRVREPDPETGGGKTAVAESFRLRYPDKPHDAETLLVHPRTGDVYIVTKAHLGDDETAVYRATAPLRAGRVTTLKKVGVLTMERGFLGRVAGLTGGSFSPDGSRVVVCDYWAAWEAAFDGSWLELHWKRIEVGARPQGEGICYRADGKALIATSEGATFPLVEVERER